MTERKVRVIKKYPNRKLYDTKTADYINYKDIARMLREGDNIVVIQNRTNEDITRFTLTQMLFQVKRENLRQESVEQLREQVLSEMARRAEATASSQARGF